MDRDLKSSSREDASPLTTSSDSETFDTWTVITDKSKDEIGFTPLTPEKSDEDEEVAADAVHVEVLKASDDLVEARYNDTDDLSDGISIISESESAGRVSPHPELRKHLSELNMRFLNITEPPLPSTTSGSTPLNYEACSERSSDTFHEVESLLEGARKSRRASGQLVQPTDTLSQRCGLRGLFYVGALLAVLAFISKLKYDSWESDLGSRTSLLTQRIDELELKNNLMRAEIDILAKQVKYLTTFSENQKHSQSKPKNSQPREHKMKVWPGNGNTIEKKEIFPDDLKKPFKCEGQNNVDIAGMCVELPMSSESVVDSLGNKAREVMDEREYVSNFENVVDRIAKFTENPFSEQTQIPTEATPTTEPPTEPKQPSNENIPHVHKIEQYNSRNYIIRDCHKKHGPKNGSGESKEKERRRHDKSDEDNGSGEQYKKSKDHKKYDKRSSMEYENAKREADGQWHEKMMQHRESARKNNEKHRHDKNWYIERGDSREQARVTEQKHRGAGQ